MFDPSVYGSLGTPVEMGEVSFSPVVSLPAGAVMGTVGSEGRVAVSDSGALALGGIELLSSEFLGSAVNGAESGNPSARKTSDIDSKRDVSKVSVAHFTLPFDEKLNREDKQALPTSTITLGPALPTPTMVSTSRVGLLGDATTLPKKGFAAGDLTFRNEALSSQPIDSAFVATASRQQAATDPFVTIDANVNKKTGPFAAAADAKAKFSLGAALMEPTKAGEWPSLFSGLQMPTQDKVLFGDSTFGTNAVNALRADDTFQLKSPREQNSFDVFTNLGKIADVSTKKTLSPTEINDAIANGAIPDNFKDLTGAEGLAAIDSGTSPTDIGAYVTAVKNANARSGNAFVASDGSLAIPLDGRAEIKVSDDPNAQSSVTVQGSALVGIGLRRPEVGVNWGYAAVDVSQGGGVVAKFLNGKKLDSNDEITMRVQFELGADGIPGIKQLVNSPLGKKVFGANVDQMDAGVVGRATIAFKDGSPYLKKIDGFGYADLPSPKGIVNINPTTKKVTPGTGGLQGATNFTAGLQWTPEKGWEKTADATNLQIKGFFDPPKNAQGNVNVNTPAFTGWAITGINSEGQERAATPLAQRIIAEAASKRGTAGAEAIADKLGKAAGYAQTAQFASNIASSLDTTKNSGRTDVGLGIVQGIVTTPPLPPGVGPLIRLEGKIIAKQDGTDKITLMAGNTVLAQTTMTDVRKKGAELSDAITRAFGGGENKPATTPVVTSAQKTPVDNLNGGSKETAARVAQIQLYTGTDAFQLVNKNGPTLNHGVPAIAIASHVTDVLKQYGAVGGLPRNASDASRMINETINSLSDRGRGKDAERMLERISEVTGKYGVNLGNQSLDVQNQRYTGPKASGEIRGETQRILNGQYKRSI